MVKQRFFPVVALALSLILVSMYGCTGSTSQEEQLRTTTLKIQEAVQSELDNLDRDMSAAASELSRAGLSGPEARQILNGLTSKYPFVIDSCTTDVAGKMVTIAPDAYSSYEGTDISTQDVMIKLNETKKPVLSRVFTAVEGMDAVVIIWPVFSEKGDFIGSVSALFKPEKFLYGASDPFLKGADISLDVMQLDGLDIYNSKGVDTGLNVFTYPEFQQYEDLQALCHRMVDQESGTGSYTITSYETGKLVKKMAYWETVKLHDTAWRVVSTQNIK
jgi:hypothetical protein